MWFPRPVPTGYHLLIGVIKYYPPLTGVIKSYPPLIGGGVIKSYPPLNGVNHKKHIMSIFLGFILAICSIFTSYAILFPL